MRARTHQRFTYSLPAGWLSGRPQVFEFQSRYMVSSGRASDCLPLFLCTVYRLFYFAGLQLNDRPNRFSAFLSILPITTLIHLYAAVYLHSPHVQQTAAQCPSVHIHILVRPTYMHPMCDMEALPHAQHFPATE